MTLSQISIRNFQSLRQADLELGDFTVIVGASSSGKSALMRAFRALASNVRGSAVITRGQKQAAITVRTQDRTVTLERTETAGTYRLHDGSGSEMVFTKLNGGVPDAVTKALRIAPVPANGASVNFASQFDRPFLLDDSGANVARTLAELTNVSTIFEAVRTANKRRLAASSLLKTRQADREVVRGNLAGFQSLPWRLERLRGAESLYDQAQAQTAQIESLKAASRTLAEAVEAEQALARLPQVPDSTELDAANNALLDLIAALRKVAARTQAWQQADTAWQTAQRAEELLNNELAELLRDAQICPTCGQPTV